MPLRSLQPVLDGYGEHSANGARAIVIRKVTVECERILSFLLAFSPRHPTLHHAAQSLFPVHVQPDLLLAVGNGHIPLRRGDDNRLSRSRGSELFRQIDCDRQSRPFDGHFYIFHDGGLSVMDNA